jgi:hypothetical protein
MSGYIEQIIYPHQLPPVCTSIKSGYIEVWL